MLLHISLEVRDDMQAPMFHHCQMVIYFADATMHCQGFKCLLIIFITETNKKQTLPPCKELLHF